MQIQLIRRRRRGTSTPTPPPAPLSGVATSPNPTNMAGGTPGWPANAVDGDTATYWQADTTVPPADLILVVTFPGTVTLSGVALLWYDATFRMVDYTVETWDGAAWDVAATVTGNAAASRSHSFTGVQTDRFRIVATAWVPPTGPYGSAVKEVTYS